MDYRDMSDEELTGLVRAVVGRIDKGGPENIGMAIKPLRDAGITCGPFRGEMAKVSPRHGLLWYAGEIIGIVEEEAWFAVNSWINCADKFAPLPKEVPPEQT
jgi:hypothetical protein